MWRNYPAIFYADDGLVRWTRYEPEVLPMLPTPTRSLRFAAEIEQFGEIDKLLAELHRIARTAGLSLCVIYRVPARAKRADRQPIPAYHHPSCSADYWKEFWPLYAEHGTSFLARMAWRNMGAFTLAEAIRHMQPTAEELWIRDLLYRHGVHELFHVPHGSWMVVFWAPKALRLDTSTRAALELAAHAAARRIEALTRRRGTDDPDPRLSPRQRAILRLAGEGYTLEQIAHELEIKANTVKEQIDRARKKLKAKNLAHAVAEAIRHYVVLALAVSLALAVICECCDNDDDTRDSALVQYCNPVELQPEVCPGL